MALIANQISNFVKYQRGKLRMTQEELAQKAGVGLRFIRELEQGKETLRMDKVNQVLALFGFEVAPANERIIDPYEILLNHSRNMRITLKNRTVLIGFIMGPIYGNEEIKGWRFVSNSNAGNYEKTKDPKLETEIDHADIENIENI